MKNNRTVFLLAVSLTLSVAGCTHPSLGPHPRSARLFPEGTYQHSVRIKTEKPQPHTMQMKGVVSSQLTRLKVIGLSTFNTTIFRIEEDLTTGAIKKEFYLDVIKAHEEQFLQFYRLIRELLLAERGQTDFTQREAHFQVSEMDSQGIYRKIHIEHPQFILDIEVTSYEF